MSSSSGSSEDSGSINRDEFYIFFDQHRIDGDTNRHILAVDLSVHRGTLPAQELLHEEQETRKAWNATKERLEKHYRNQQRTVSTSVQLLCERVVPPLFVENFPSTRYKSAAMNPRNPANIHVWRNFKEDVDAYSPAETDEHELIGSMEDDVFSRSLGSKAVVREEKCEEYYFIERVLTPLRDGKLVNFPYDQRVSKQGLPDYVLTAGEGDDAHCCMAIEIKSTHSLPLPMLDEEVVNAYNIGRTTESNEQQRRYKERVCDPIGQLLRYMVVNGVRYGALSSASRTYFVKIEDEGKDVGAKVCVSGAWFLGDKNYLRAWAYCYSQSIQADVSFNPQEISWGESDEVQSGNESSNEDEGSGTELENPSYEKPAKSQKNATFKAASAQSQQNTTSAMIPTVPFASLSFKKPLGYGRNGCVFRALWEGKHVAVKQFDLGRSGVYEMFRKEITAYELLKHAQGILVPNALFLTKSDFSIVYLGLQLGRMPTEGDDMSDWEHTLKRLRTEYGFHHGDANPRNAVFIKGELGERLVAIDLEEYTLRKKK